MYTEEVDVQIFSPETNELTIKSESKDLLTNVSSCSPNSSSIKPNIQSKKPTVVVTKTSPIVAADLSCEELEIEEDPSEKESSQLNDTFKNILPSKDSDNKHEIIKQVSDSMENLKNQLLNKGMNNIANEVDSLNKSLESNTKKQEELDRIKQEQEIIRVEKVYSF